MRSVTPTVNEDELFNIGRDRFDPAFAKLVKEADKKGLKLHRNCFCMGFVLKFPDGKQTNLKSFSKLKQTILNYQGS